MPPVWNLPRDHFADMQRALRTLGYGFEDRPHQAFLARKAGVSANLYDSGKLTINGSDGAAMRKVEAILESLGATRASKSRPAPDSLDGISGVRIGTDESGKGDYFGPLVVAGALVTPETELALKAIGVRDSKKLTASRIAALAPRIRGIVGTDCFEEVFISPEKYNQLYDSMQGLNPLLGWAHARAIENLLERNPGCELAVADQFGDERAIKQALMAKGRQTRLLQTPKGERDTAVAAASVLARDRFVRAVDAMGENWAFEFPKGSTQVLAAGVRFVLAHGEQALPKVAKVHFATTGAVLREARRTTGAAASANPSRFATTSEESNRS